jgi:hypothetical protein
MTHDPDPQSRQEMRDILDRDRRDREEPEIPELVKLDELVQHCEELLALALTYRDVVISRLTEVMNRDDPRL